MQGHRNLIVWQKAMQLVVAVYKLSKSFPTTETYGLASSYKGQRFQFRQTLQRVMVSSVLTPTQGISHCQRLTRGTRNPVGDR
jgi:hypothetical protein